MTVKFRKVTGISFGAAPTLTYGDTGASVSATVTVANGAGTGVTYSSLETNVVDVDSSTGDLTIAGAGSATITAASTFDPEKIATQTLTVGSAALAGTLSLSDITVTSGTGGNYSGSVTLTGGLTAGIDYTLSITKDGGTEPSAISIDNNGNITIGTGIAVADAGTYIVTATGKGNYTGTVTDTFTLTVEKIDISQNNVLTLNVNDELAASGRTGTHNAEVTTTGVLSGGTDYTLSISNRPAGADGNALTIADNGVITINVAATDGGEYTVKATGQGEYTGEVTDTFILTVWGGLSPADGVYTLDSTPELSWDMLPDAVSYEVRIADSGVGLENATPEPVTDTTYTPSTELTNNMAHYWQVRAVYTNDSRGDWSYRGSIKVYAIETVEVTGGTFQMGTADDDPAVEDNEKPQHSVTLDSFHMSKTEVTQGQWMVAMTNNPSGFSGDNRPVETVNWYDAVEYCNALSGEEGRDPVYTITRGAGNSITGVTANFTKNGWRLPTEAEWEYAARGGISSQGYTYSGSNDLDEVAWYGGNSTAGSGKEVHVVGTKNPNELGIYDMSGNVWEWCWDWYVGTYPSESQTNPRGPVSGTQRIFRGGSWYNDDSKLMRPAYRFSYAPDGTKLNNVGFRLVCRTP